MKTLALIAAATCLIAIITFIDDQVIMGMFGVLLIFPMAVLYVLSRKKED